MTFNKISILGLLYLIMSGMLITSCSSADENGNNNDDPVTIMLTSNVDVISRTSLQDIQIENGQEVGFFVKKTSPSADVLYTNEKLTATGNGGFIYSTPMFYPVSNENVDFCAYHPYMAGCSLDNPLSFSIKPDQSEKVSYLNSDLLYARKQNISKSTSAVPLKFYHKLSKLNFTIKEGPGMDLSGLTSVEVLNLLPETAIDLANGLISNAFGDITPINVYGVHGIAESETQVEGMAAIVIPQDFTAGNRLFKVTVNGGTGNEVSYYYTPNTDFSFESGKKYTYILTINHAGITITSSIEDWVSGGDPIEGEGTID
ncbi:MAG: fimbrillin family protein [Prevotellaceae bacterium]|jgi:hypothetical protein|nr:fimbrillin family protein [Prevotellaceae bacterium]